MRIGRVISQKKLKNPLILPRKCGIIIKVRFGKTGVELRSCLLYLKWGDAMALVKGLSSIEAKADKAVRGVVEEHGFTLWDVVFVKEGACWYLRILIDKRDGVSIDDCASIDSEINAIIDGQDFIDKIDFLEIGSAGLERAVRRVEQLAPSIGKKIMLKTYKLCEGLPDKHVKCVLEAFDGEKITVSGDFGSAEVLLSEVSSINYDDFDDYESIMEG